MSRSLGILYDGLYSCRSQQSNNTNLTFTPLLLHTYSMYISLVSHTLKHKQNETQIVLFSVSASYTYQTPTEG